MLGTENTSAWAECLWGWDSNWKAKKTQIPAELIPQEVEKFALRSISLLIRFGIKRN